MKYSKHQMMWSHTQLFVVLAELLLLLRVVLRFFNANPDASFVHWAYQNTQVLLQPFRAVFTSTDVVSRGWAIDWVALFAMAAYAAAASILMGLGMRWMPTGRK